MVAGEGGEGGLRREEGSKLDICEGRLPEALLALSHPLLALSHPQGAGSVREAEATADCASCCWRSSPPLHLLEAALGLLGLLKLKAVFLAGIDGIEGGIQMFETTTSRKCGEQTLRDVGGCHRN